ncbi:unnamed protein product [Didymodactylos carnosus]|uniref:MULE transposase domain-containing protein n=1 Tax=Didymodactylos carnosus TaxID=1234261 RepID=A0A814IJK8_9BILA|nr:unnamed protein product [Didymodactylos carnosus]CAF3793837.1 unnamed protein product [Didymodactylos carnosus]
MRDALYIYKLGVQNQGAYNAFSDVYPNAMVNGCYFHFTKNIWKRIKKLGLVRDCKKEEIRREIANIMSLPLLPTNELNNSMELIIDTLSNTDDKYIKLTDYVIITYISGKFDIQFWNLYDTIGLPSKKIAKSSIIHEEQLIAAKQRYEITKDIEIYKRSTRRKA